MRTYEGKSIINKERKIDMNTDTIDSIKLDAFIIDSMRYEKISSVQDTTTVLCKSEKEIGEFINKPLHINSAVVVSIVIFILGFVINEAIRRRSNSYKLKQYKQFIDEWIAKSTPTLTQYINSLDEFAKAIKINTDLNIAFWETVIIHTTKINEIPMEKYADIYIFGLSHKEYAENRKNLMNLLYQLDYLHSVREVIKEIYKEYCSQNDKIMEEWNMYYIQLLDLLGDAKRSQYSHFEDEVTSVIYNSFIKLLREDGSFAGTEKWESDFIIPSLRILEKDEYRKSIILLQIMRLIRNLRITIIKHNYLNKYSDVFEEYVKSLNTAQRIINESIDYFDKKKIKRFCK